MSAHREKLASGRWNDDADENCRLGALCHRCRGGSGSRSTAAAPWSGGRLNSSGDPRFRPHAASALRAVARCAAFAFLVAHGDSYKSWRELVLIFRSE